VAGTHQNTLFVELAVAGNLGAASETHTRTTIHVVSRSGAWGPTCIGPMQSFKHVILLF